jgi:hypothetical protein
LRFFKTPAVCRHHHANPGIEAFADLKAVTGDFIAQYKIRRQRTKRRNHSLFLRETLEYVRVHAERKIRRRNFAALINDRNLTAVLRQTTRKITQHCRFCAYGFPDNKQAS